ncbi:hypothetical protein Pelo_18224 [Pelomyxa schiedti]|nr:hypothetical protein Pelo_18224 [Pelomyxa schiedti]
MDQGHITIDRVLDARDQALTMLLALCPPPPTIRSRGAIRLTNDAARDLAERWVLTPVRRFIFGTGMEFSTVVSIGPTLGVVSTSETNLWTTHHSRLCWLDPDRLLACHSITRTTCIFDFSRGPHPRVDPIPCPPVGPCWGNHKWAVARGPGAGVSMGAGHLPCEGPEMRDLDVVFSHSEPALIKGEGDEASMVFGFGAVQPKTDRPRATLLTVDLARSFSSGSLVVVRETGFSGDPEGVLWCCRPLIFMDDSGHPVVVHEGGNCSFAVSLWTGKRTKLCDQIYAMKVNGQLARIGMGRGMGQQAALRAKGG